MKALFPSLIVYLYCVSSGHSTLILQETFDTEVADTASFLAQYTDFTVNGTDPASVTSGVLLLTDNGANDTTTVTVNGVLGEVIYSADIGALSSGGAYNVGMQIGANSIAFHPGHVPIPGAFRVDGIGGFGNQDMGFVPANGTLHHLEVHQYPSGLFEITFTDGDNPANVYMNAWTNPASVGGPVGFRRSGPLGTSPGQGLYDNFTIDVIPEPSSFALLSLGLVVFTRRIFKTK